MVKISLISTKLANMSLKEAREIFERDYLVYKLTDLVGIYQKRLLLSKWKEAHYIN